MDHRTQLILFHILLIPSRTATPAVFYGQCQSSYGRHLALTNELCWDPWRTYAKSFLRYVAAVQPQCLGWDTNICYCFVSAALQLNFKWISENCDSFYGASPWFMRGGHTCEQCCVRVCVCVVVGSGICHRLHSSLSAECWNNKVSPTRLPFNCFFSLLWHLQFCQPPPHSCCHTMKY